MPTYDYRCPVCGVFEHFQGMYDDALGDCPVCGSAVKRLVSGGTGVIFKGSGFFNTDRKKNSSTVTNSEVKTEMKPDASSAKIEASVAKDSA